MNFVCREHKEWKLHIANVQESDRGWYMCQVNNPHLQCTAVQKELCCILCFDKFSCTIP